MFYAVRSESRVHHRPHRQRPRNDTNSSRRECSTPRAEPRDRSDERVLKPGTEAQREKQGRKIRPPGIHTSKRQDYEHSSFKNSPVLVQGITGKIGSVQTRWMKEYGTNIVAGHTGKGGVTARAFRSLLSRGRGLGNRRRCSVFFVPAAGSAMRSSRRRAGIRIIVVCRANLFTI